MDAPFEIIDAFVDGERVDATALKRALSEDDGRDYLVDAWLLREGVQDAMVSDAAVLAASTRSQGRRSWIVAAAAAVLCLVAGYVVGYRTAGQTGSVATTNKDAAPVTAGARQTPASFPVPVPTRVIQIEFGADPAAGRGGD